MTGCPVESIAAAANAAIAGKGHVDGEAARRRMRFCGAVARALSYSRPVSKRFAAAQGGAELSPLAPRAKKAARSS
jgi:hypothetical protein